MIRALVTGVSGRMGAALCRMVRQDPELLLVGGTLRQAPEAQRPELPVFEDLGEALAATSAQVVIDFTSARSSVEHARVCAEKGVALVIGSTGFGPETKAEVRKASTRIPLVLAPNMSVGVNLVIRMAGQLAQALGEDFDVEIVEAHHRMKKDAPSGTALGIAEEVARALGRTREDFRTARQGQVGERPSQEIGIQALRGGDVVGEHTVFFFGEGERVELTHRATSRDPFAAGAVRAAKWVVGRAPGFYQMQDVLGREGAR